MENSNPAKHDRPYRGGATAAIVPDSKFDLKAKSFALTYPKCTLSTDLVLEKLRGLHANALFVCVSTEKHKDGTPHLHACVLLPEVFRTKRARNWDIEGFHPNVQGIRSIPKWLAYIRKVTQTDLNY